MNLFEKAVNGDEFLFRQLLSYEKLLREGKVCRLLLIEKASENGNINAMKMLSFVQSLTRIWLETILILAFVFFIFFFQKDENLLSLNIAKLSFFFRCLSKNYSINEQNNKFYAKTKIF